MAKQQTHIPIRGTIGDITYFEYDGKYFCKKKNAVPSEVVQNDPAFAPFRRQHQISSRCISLAAAIYKLVPESRRNGKLYRSMVKWMCHPENRYKDLIPLIHEALLHFKLVLYNTPLSNVEQLIEQIRSTLPFFSLLPEEDPTPVPKKVRKKKYTQVLPPTGDLSTLMATLQQLAATLTELHKRLPQPAPKAPDAPAWKN
jgi:hypothetical protein